MQSERKRKDGIKIISRSFIFNTSLHGIKYLGDARRHLFERAFWGLILIIFISFSSKTLFQKWWGWRSSQMLIKTSNIPYTISSFAVPAITVCDAYGLEEMFSLPKNVSGDADWYEMNYRRFIDIVLPDNGVSRSEGKIDNTHNTSTFETKYFKMENSMFLKLFNSKTFKNQALVDSEADSDASLASDGPIMCYDSLTLHGYCFTCNIIPPTEMFKNNTVHHHFKLAYSLDPNSTLSHQEEKLQGFPFIAMTSEARNRTYSYPSLNKSPINTFTHKTCDPPDSKDKNYVCNIPDEYKSRHREFAFYSIHNPYDVPSPFMRWYYDKKFMNHELQVLVDATSYLLIDDESFERPPHDRECFSSTSEKTLEFFKYYTRRNCLVECFTNKILENCSCVLYFLPHTEDTPICGNAESKACAYVIMDDVNIESSWDDCDCLASCNHTEYRAISREIIPQPNSTTQYTMVLRDDTLYPKIRRQADTLEELVQSSMTYLDMFLGVSLISLVEIVYYILLMCMECLGINRTIRRSMKRFERKDKKRNKVFTVDQCPKVDDKKESLDECSRISFETNTLKKRVALFAKNEFY